MISFTGSTAVGRHIGEVAAKHVTRVALELGGKSPNVILDDADLQAAVADGVGKALLNCGQTCTALTRMLVPTSKLDEATQIATAVAQKWAVGDPFDESTRLGPLVSATQRDRVLGLDRGYFVQPTIFTDVSNEMKIAQEEIFGPVLSILPYEDEDDAVRIANDTIYGLAGGVWSGDEERALRVARRIRAGQVEVNGGAFNPLAPFGGYNQSGHGREAGRFGLEEFCEVKAIQR
jgi:aldehyde dehydrogenase (NAD+)